MNTRFYNAKILVLDAENHFSIAEDELHVTGGNTITYIGMREKQIQMPQRPLSSTAKLTPAAIS